MDDVWGDVQKTNRRTIVVNTVDNVSIIILNSKLLETIGSAGAAATNASGCGVPRGWLTGRTLTWSRLCWNRPRRGTKGCCQHSNRGCGFVRSGTHRGASSCSVERRSPGSSCV